MKIKSKKITKEKVVKRSNPLTFNEIKKELSKLGITLIHKDDQWIIYETDFTKNLTGIRRSEGFDMNFSNLSTVYKAGKNMAKRLKSRSNPKCKTFQVKRKVKIAGRPRVILVRRKICNPKNEGGYYKSMSYGNLPTKKEFEKAFEEQVNGIYYRIRNDKYIGTIDLTESELWTHLKRAIKINRDIGLDWASTVLDTLGFEWI